MELKLYRGAKLLELNGIYQEGNLYIPGPALESYVGVWKDKVVFLDSPLASKRICVTVLGPGTFKQGLPPTVDLFLSLCSAAGAQIIYYDGGKVPAGDLIIALEMGGDAPNVSYLGASFRSKPLANKIVANLKRGLGLTYLPDSMAFPKSRYNIKLALGARLFTPAVAVQLPPGLDEVGPWLFTSLMEYVGNGAEMDADIFLTSAQPATHSDFPPPIPAPEQPSPSPTPVIPRAAASSSSASMSRTQYPDFFAQLEQRKKPPIKKEPFT